MDDGLNPSHLRYMTRHTHVLTAGIVAVGIQAFVIAPLLHDVAVGLGTGPGEVARALGAFGVGVVLASLALGRLLDRVARRTALTAGMVTAVLAAAGSAVAPSWEALALAQFAAGLGVGVVLPVTYALAAELAPPGAGARATGRVLLGWSIALVAGVPLAAVLGDAVGWRGVFVVLAVVFAAQVALYRLLPDGRTSVGAPTPRLRDVVRLPGVLPLLGGVAAFMIAFYGVFAFVGVEIRQVHGVGATAAGLLALAYGAGFGLAAVTDRFLDRGDPDRLVAPALALLAGVYLLLGAVTSTLTALFAAAVVWGLVNHVGLTLLVSRLAARAPAARGPVFALYSAATYGGAAVAGLLAGPLQQAAGFGLLTVAAAVVVAFAVPLTRRTASPCPVPALAIVR